MSRYLYHIESHPEELSDGTKVWVSTIAGTNITSQGFTLKEADKNLREALKAFCQTASKLEIKDTLASAQRMRKPPPDLIHIAEKHY